MDDRELDRRVAEHLFGWQEQTPIETPLGVIRAWEKKTRRSEPFEHIQTDYMLDLPAYSTTWAGAGLVVEAMRERGWWCRIVSPFGKEDEYKWFAGFTPFLTTGWNGRPDYECGDDCAPRAVARAALAALGKGE